LGPSALSSTFTTHTVPGGGGVCVCVCVCVCVSVHSHLCHHTLRSLLHRCSITRATATPHTRCTAACAPPRRAAHTTLHGSYLCLSARTLDFSRLTTVTFWLVYTAAGLLLPGAVSHLPRHVTVRAHTATAFHTTVACRDVIFIPLCHPRRALASAALPRRAALRGASRLPYAPRAARSPPHSTVVVLAY